MEHPQELSSKLKNADVEIENYVSELEKENLKLQKQIAKLQVQVLSQQNQITALKKAQQEVVINVTDYSSKK